MANAFFHGLGQHLFLVFRALLVIKIHAGHADHTGRDALFGQRVIRFVADFHFGTGADENDVGHVLFAFAQDISAF